jgi:hypothetical protein
VRFVLAGALTAAAAAAPAAAYAVDYLSAEQAARLMFPDADAFEPREISLDAAQLQALAAEGVHGRSERWALRVAKHAGQPLGYVVSDDVLGKFELISYAVGIGLDGAIKQVEILSYRESHGGEVRLPAWRRQFVGKTAAAPIKVGDDIANISGATLSCTHLAEGVRRIVAVVALARKNGSLD